MDHVSLLMQHTLEDREQQLKSIKAHLLSSSTNLEIIPASKITTTSLVGLQDVKQEILETMKERRGFQRLLIFGAPGSGKTELVRISASQLKANLIYINRAKVLLEWAQCLELYTKSLCEIVKDQCGQTDTILFLNHFDFYCTSEEEDESDVRNLSHFLRHVQWSWAESGLKLAIVASTCQPQKLKDKVALGFHRFVYVPTLNFHERKELLWKEILKVWKGEHTLTDEDVEKISENCFSIRAVEIRILVVTACQEKNPDWSEDGDKGIESVLLEMRYRNFHPVTLNDFEKACQEGFPHLEQNTFQEFQTFYQKYENKPLLSMSEREKWVFKEDVPINTAQQRNQVELMSQANEHWFWGMFSWL